MTVTVTHSVVTSGTVNAAAEVDLAAWNAQHVITNALDKTGDTMSGALTVSNATASISTLTGSIIASGGVGVAGQMSANNIAVFNPLSANASFDANGAPVVGTGAALTSSFPIGPSGAAFMLVFVAETVINGNGALYLCSNGVTVLISTTSALWAASTTTPGAGTCSVAYSTTLNIYNNFNTTARFKAVSFRI